MGLNVELLDTPKEEICVFDTHITHNLAPMAEAAGLYMACWRPEEINAVQAKDIISILEKGLKELEDHPDIYRTFDASNGWGTYDQFVPWVKEYLHACKIHPEAKIYADR